jgi:hypothetical protein
MFRRGGLALAASMLLAGTIGGVGATSASARDWGGGCRSDNAGWAEEPGKFSLDPRLYVNSSSFIYGTLEAENPDRVNADYCAQLLRVLGDGSTKVEFDLGCAGWTNSDGVIHSARGDSFNLWASRGTAAYPGPGEYVQIGYWATINGKYGKYGNAQSPRVYVDQP